MDKPQPKEGQAYPDLQSLRDAFEASKAPAKPPKKA